MNQIIRTKLYQALFLNIFMIGVQLTKAISVIDFISKTDNLLQLEDIMYDQIYFESKLDYDEDFVKIKAEIVSSVMISPSLYPTSKERTLEIVSLETVIELLKLNVHCTKHSIWVKNPYRTVLIDVGNKTLIQINQILMEPKNLKSFPCAYPKQSYFFILSSNDHVYELQLLQQQIVPVEPNQSLYERRKNLNGYILQVGCIVTGLPYLLFNPEPFGIHGDLSKLFMQEFNFRINWIEQDTYGTKKNGTWNGVMKELIDNNVDVAMMELSHSPERFEDISVSYPGRLEKACVYFWKQPYAALSPMSYFDVFHIYFWIGAGLTIIACSLMIFTIDKIWCRHYGYNSNHYM
jgi:hypothetical protein